MIFIGASSNIHSTNACGIIALAGHWYTLMPFNLILDFLPIIGQLDEMVITSIFNVSYY
jgi:uncharacterized membrane protein YkvA (DUF1232 family)